MTPALLPILGLLLAADAPALVSESSPPTEGGSAEQGSPAKEPAAAKLVDRTIPLPPPPVLRPRSEAAKQVERPIPLPPPPVLRPRPEAAKQVERPIPLPPPPVLRPRPEAELAKGEILLEQKCSKCHDLSWAFAAELSDAQWRGHIRRMNSRPGAALTEEQARKIHDALKARRVRSATR